MRCFVDGGALAFDRAVVLVAKAGDFLERDAGRFGFGAKLVKAPGDVVGRREAIGDRGAFRRWLVGRLRLVPWRVLLRWFFGRRLGRRFVARRMLEAERRRHRRGVVWRRRFFGALVLCALEDGRRVFEIGATTRRDWARATLRHG